MNEELFLDAGNEKVKEFDKWMACFSYHIGHPSEDKKCPPIASLARSLTLCRNELVGDTAKLRALLDSVRILRQAGGPGTKMAERTIMECLVYLTMKVCRNLGSGKREKFLHLDEQCEVPASQRQVFEAAREICRYAIECFRFFRKRDSFGGGRRAMAFEILSCASGVFDLPEAVVLARHGLQKKDSEEAEDAADFLAAYYEYRKKTPGREDVRALKNLAGRAGSHSTAMSALNALISAGAMGEMEALSRIEDWKEKHWK